MWDEREKFAGEYRGLKAERDELLNPKLSPARDVMGFCMERVRGCDEVKDDDGLCDCARYIGSWLASFGRVRDAALEAVTSVEAERDELRASSNTLQGKILEAARWIRCGIIGNACCWQLGNDNCKCHACEAYRHFRNLTEVKKS